MNADTILVIGYGNTLRGDDGLGPAVATAVAERNWPNVEALVVPQLTPELAEILARVRAAVFVDARTDAANSIHAVLLDPAGDDAFVTHSGNPGALLALAGSLYGRVPPAWLVAVGGHHFGLCETLSPVARYRVQAAVDWIAQLIETLVRDSAAAASF